MTKTYGIMTHIICYQVTMSSQEYESDKTAVKKDVSNPRDYAIPLMESYLLYYREMLQPDLYHVQNTICMSSITADWASYIKENAKGVREYLDMSFEALKTTTSEVSRRLLSEPVISVLRKIRRVDEGQEIFEEYFLKAQEFCKQNPDYKNFGEYLLLWSKFKMERFKESISK